MFEDLDSGQRCVSHLNFITAFAIPEAMIPAPTKPHHIGKDKGLHRYQVHPIHEHLLEEERNGFHSSTREGIPLSILVVTWNLMGTIPPLEELEKLFADNQFNHDLVVIGR